VSLSVNGQPLTPGDHKSITFVRALLEEYQEKVHALAIVLEMLTARRHRREPSLGDVLPKMAAAVMRRRPKATPPRKRRRAKAGR
jgi:hypothetical protein